MAIATSVLLDCLRIAAALMVFASHCADFWFPGKVPAFARFAHCAVVTFFVISGYVIACSAERKSQIAKDYVVARVSRLYSVVLPALALTCVLQFLGELINPIFYAKIGRDGDLLRYVLSAAFLQSVWTFCASPPTNGPLWSLCYEFWYYVLFGVFTFVRRSSWRIISLGIGALIVGPNVLLLMPCWLVGVVLYKYASRVRMSQAGAISGLVVAVTGLVLVVGFVPAFPFEVGQGPLYFSGRFLSDWLLALLIAIVIGCYDRVFCEVKGGGSMGLRSIADCTFPLYLYHYPIIVFATAVLTNGVGGVWKVGTVITGILCVVGLLGWITEAKKGVWRVWVLAGWEIAENLGRRFLLVPQRGITM